MISVELNKELKTLENSIRDSDFPAKGKSLLKFFRSIPKLESQITDLSKDESVHFFSRVAACYDRYFLNVNNQISKEQYLQFLPFINQVAYVYFLSGQGSSSHAFSELRKTALVQKNDKIGFKSEELAYQYMLLCNPESEEATEDLIGLLKQGGKPILAVLFQFLSFRLYALDSIFERQIKVLNAFVKMDALVPSINSLNNLHLLWAISSYWPEQLNQKTKSKISAMLRLAVSRSKLEIAPVNKHIVLEEKSKPTLLIIAEALYKEHVMFSCFGPSLQELRSRFNLVVFTAKEDLGTSEWDWVDDLYTFSVHDFAVNIQIDRIQKIQPQIILYPSIGMKFWSILMAQFRLAPLQISLLGHPDFPYSNEIDHVVGGKDLLVPKMTLNPKYVRMEGASGSLFDLRQKPKTNSDPRFSIFMKKTEDLKVISCINVFKLNQEFASSLQQIQRQSDRKFEFHLLQNLTGLPYQVGRKQIHQLLGEDRVYVYPHLSFKEYQQLLLSCDLYISPFPFGGENSTLDALLAGLPVVARKGPTPRERLDYRVLNQAGLAKEFCTDTNEEYVKRTVSLISDQSQLRQATDLVGSKSIAEIFRAETENHSNELAEVIWSLHLKFLHDSAAPSKS